MEFHEGVNVINQPNGWGKSTLAAFFKAMLFGLDHRREAGMDETERKIYEPWQGGKYGGELDFEAGGKKYRVCRYFGTSERMDTFQLYDLASGHESRDFSANLGEELFELDRNSFRKTVFIAQNDCGTGNSDSISAKLGNLSEAAQEISGFERANDKIRKRLEQLSLTNQAGSRVQRKAAIEQLKQETTGLDHASQQAEEIRTKMWRKQQQYQELMKIRSEYEKALITASEDGRRRELLGSYAQMQEELTERRAEIDSYEQFFPNGIPADEVFEDGKQLMRQREEQKIQLTHLDLTDREKQLFSEKKAQLRSKVPTDEDISDMQKRAEELSRNQKKRMEMEGQITGMERQAVLEKGETFVDPTPVKSQLPLTGTVLLIVGLLMLGGGAAGFFMQFSRTGSIVLLAAGGILAAVGLVLLIMGKQADAANAAALAHKLEARDRQMEASEKPIRDLTEEMKQLEKEIKNSEAILKRILAGYPFLDNRLPFKEQIYDLRAAKQQYEDLMERQQQYEDACAREEELEKRLQDFAALLGIACGPSMQAQVNYLQGKASEHAMKTAEWRKLNQRLQNFESANDVNSIMNTGKCPYTLEELHQMISDADHSIEELRSSMDRNNKQLEDLQQQLDTRDEKKQELAILQDLQAKESREYEILKLTSQYMNKSKEQYTNRYMGSITKAFARYYRMLTGHSSDSWMIDADLSLKLREHGKMRDAKWLSAGYRDLLGVCMRMAMVDAMYQGENPFLIFDDPFVNLDNEKLENGKQLLAALSREYQVVYFTCHESRRLDR